MERVMEGGVGFLDEESKSVSRDKAIGLLGAEQFAATCATKMIIIGWGMARHRPAFF